MSPRLAIVDTNVLVAGLLTRELDSPTRRIVDAMLLGSLPFLLSADLLAEYRQVLLRPKIRAAHGLSEAEVDEILFELARLAIVREVTSAALVETRGDEHLFALLTVDDRAVLVSGDAAVLRRAGERGVSPRQLVDDARR